MNPISNVVSEFLKRMCYMHAGVEKSGGITSVLVSMCQNFFFFFLSL